MSYMSYIGGYYSDLERHMGLCREYVGCRFKKGHGEATFRPVFAMELGSLS